MTTNVMNNAIIKFIEANRKQGSTTAMAKLAMQTDGYLIVHSISMRKRVLALCDFLDAEHILTLLDLKNGATKGNQPRPIYFDTATLASIVNSK